MNVVELAPWNRLKTLPFIGVHVAAVVGVCLLGWSWSGLLLAIAMYYVRMFGVSGGYHRYFSHRTYRTSRWFQLVLAILAQTSLQKGVLWWAAHHRMHHKYSDTSRDPHSFREHGFWHSHVGWILSKDSETTDEQRVSDLARFPELRWLWDLRVPPKRLLGGRREEATVGARHEPSAVAAGSCIATTTMKRSRSMSDEK